MGNTTDEDANTNSLEAAKLSISKPTTKERTVVC